MRGPLAYIGGKNAVAKQIIDLFPGHTTYVEPFAGGAQVFFRKEPSKVEVLNDLDTEMTNLFRVCQQHYEELIRYLRFAVVSRTWFELLVETDPTKLTDIQRAARCRHEARAALHRHLARVARHRHPGTALYPARAARHQCAQYDGRKSMTSRKA